MDHPQNPLETEADGQRWLSSGLGRWMTFNHSLVAAMIRGGGLDWIKTAESLGSAGYMDMHGKSPTAEVAEETWSRVNIAAGLPAP